MLTQVLQIKVYLDYIILRNSFFRSLQLGRHVNGMATVLRCTNLLWTPGYLMLPQSQSSLGEDVILPSMVSCTEKLGRLNAKAEAACVVLI
jgi:hypothetical protein